MESDFFLVKTKIMSEVLFEDDIKLWTVSQYLKDTGYTAGGYIGYYTKGEEGRVAIPPIGPDAVGKFEESVFTVVGQKEGPVRYGDVVVLVTPDGTVWNNRCTKSSYAGFFEGYLGFRPRKTDGQLSVSFQKNGREGTIMCYGDTGVYIDVEASYHHKYAFNYRLTNYKSQSSAIVGGYICSDNTGYDISFQLHRHSGPPVNAYSMPRKTFRNTSVKSFVPPNITSVGVIRKDTNFHQVGEEDIMVRDPMYGSHIKLYDVSPNDDLAIVLDGGTTFLLEADQLFRMAEAHAGEQASLELSVAAKTKKPVGNRVVQLDSIDVFVHLDISLLQAEFPEKFQHNLQEDKVQNPQIWTSVSKLVVTYLVCASFIPYVYCETILLMGFLIRPLRQYLNSSSLDVFTKVATTLLSMKGVHDVSEGLPNDPYEVIQITTFTAVWFAFSTCFLLGLLTPGFIIIRQKKLAVNLEDDLVANWVISLNIPNVDFHAYKAQSTRTLLDSDEETASDEEEDDDNEESRKFKVDGVRLGGKWGEAGVNEKGIPLHPAFNRFLQGENGDLQKAKRRWIRTCEWRKEGNIDNILFTPHKHFHILKRCLPNYIYGRSKNNSPIYIDRPGHANIKELRKSDIGLNELLFHFTYVSEFLWTVIEDNEDAKRISILDLDNVGMFDMKGIVLDYLKKTIFLSGEHYPERGYKIYIVNAPTFFSGIWSMIKSMMNVKTVSKIQIIRNKGTMELLKDIDVHVLPVIFGGDNQIPLDQSKEEIKLVQHANKYLS